MEYKMKNKKNRKKDDEKQYKSRWNLFSFLALNECRLWYTMRNQMWTKPKSIYRPLFFIEYIQFEYLTRTPLRLPWHSLCMLLFARDILWMNDKSHVSTTYDNDNDADCWQIEETQPRINVSSAHKWLDIGNKNHTSVYDV